MSTTRPFDAFALAAELFAEGYAEGQPAHLTGLAEQADLQLCRALRCPACRKRGMTYHPFTNDAHAYRALAVCGACGAGEEI
jgi:hypothetical protein